MSKKTNSLLLRYGFNVFWSSSICNPNLEYRNLLFLNLLTFFFKLFNFQILKIQYTLQNIWVYVYSYKERHKFLNRYILHLEKFLLTKYFLRTTYGFKFIKKSKLSSKIKKGKRKILFIFFILFFLVWKILILKWFIFLKYFKLLFFKKIYLLSFIFNLNNKKIKHFFLKKKKYLNFKFF